MLTRCGNIELTYTPLADPSDVVKVIQAASGVPVFSSVNLNTPDGSDPMASSSLKQ